MAAIGQLINLSCGSICDRGAHEAFGPMHRSSSVALHDHEHVAL